MLNDVTEFCANELGRPVHLATASRYMGELGFSSRKMQTKSSGFSVTTDSAIEMAYQWLEKHHIDLAPSKVWSIDCVFTGHRTDTNLLLFLVAHCKFFGAHCKFFGSDFLTYCTGRDTSL